MILIEGKAFNNHNFTTKKLITLQPLRLRGSHPLVVRNAERSLSWQDFLLAQEAEQYVEENGSGLTPHEYYRGHFPERLTWKKITKSFGWLCVFITISFVISCVPSVYVAKYLLEKKYDDVLAFLKYHPVFVMKVKYDFSLQLE